MMRHLGRSEPNTLVDVTSFPHQSSESLVVSETSSNAKRRRQQLRRQDRISDDADATTKLWEKCFQLKKRKKLKNKFFNSKTCFVKDELEVGCKDHEIMIVTESCLLTTWGLESKLCFKDKVLKQNFIKLFLNIIILYYVW